MTVIWTAVAVKRIQFKVLNSVLIQQDTGAAGVVIKMQMRPLMHLVFFTLKSFFQMFTQIAMLCFVIADRDLGKMRTTY